MSSFWSRLFNLLSLLTLSIILDQSLGAAQVSASTPAHYLTQLQEQPTSRSQVRQSEQEPPEFRPGTPGICRFYNLSGYLSLSADNQMVTLRPYCQQQRNWVWYEEGKFWNRFRDAATAETLAFAQTLDRDQIEVYALSICPFLADGGTLQELSQIQADQRFPTEFEQAITVAAVRTYCRRYRHQLND